MKTPSEMSGLELRVAIAKEVMGMLQHDYSADKREFPQCAHCGDTLYHGENPIGWCLAQEPDAYESSIEAAFQVIGALSAKGYDTCLSNGNGPTFAWDCEMTPKGRDTRKPCVLGQANDPALAICRAALAATRAEK